MSAKNYSYTCHAMNPVHHTLLPNQRYNVVGIELCPTTGKQHFQGYVQFTERITLKTYKRDYCEHCHVSVSLGTAQQNKAYCIKDGNFAEMGTPMTSGHRSDLHAVTDRLVKRDTLRDVALDHPTTYIRNYRGIKDFLCIAQPPMPRNVRIVKIGSINRPTHSDEIWYHNASNKPAGYFGQKIAVIRNGDNHGPEVHDWWSGFPCYICDVPCQIELYYDDQL